MRSTFCFALALSLFTLGGCDAVGENPALYGEGIRYEEAHRSATNLTDPSLLETETMSLPSAYSKADTSGWGN